MTLRLPTNRFVRHLLFWTLVWVSFFGLEEVFPLLLFGTPGKAISADWVRNWGLFIWVQLPVMLLYSYCATYVLLPFVLHRQYGRFSLGLVLLVLLTWFLFGLLRLSYLVIPVLAHQPVRFGYETIKQIFNWRLFMLDFMGSPFFRINIAAGLMVGTRLFNQWRQMLQESQRLERHKLQNELNLLKLQLDPSFLFGLLNTLHILTRRKPKLAPSLVLNLAHFLRYVLYESRAETVRLASEVETIEQYVFLQRVMHPTGLEVSLTIRGDADNRAIAPLVLLPIVQNAFRQLPIEHASQPSGEPNWISIDLSIGQTHLTLKVINGQTINQPDEAAWLVDVQKQLHFYYAESFDLQVRADVDTHIVSLTLPAVPQPDLAVPNPLPENGLTTSAIRLI